MTAVGGRPNLVVCTQAGTEGERSDVRPLDSRFRGRDARNSAQEIVIFAVQ
jgi:hypothetical protein